jgi:Ca-activated chloride channel family protein
VATVVPSLARTVNGQAVATGADNPFTPVGQTQLSTFSIDVDTASYSSVRRFITQNQRPPRDVVRIEELINYFSYDYPAGAGTDPVTGNIEVASAPWNPEHRLVRIGVRAKSIQRSQKAANLVFLIDVSGSMMPPERLPLLKSSLKMLVDRLTESDRVSIVTYAGAAGVALQPTSGDRKETILTAIENLSAGGSTNGAAGIQTAYDMAVANFVAGGVNRVILATDGDFNVGVTNQNDLVRLIEGKARSGVFLSVLGVGQDFKDTLLEKLADKGNGNYAYLDTLNEARKVLLEQMDATLVTVAKDVKIQVEFNPEHVSAYRLIGYEDRVLANADFNNDAKDAGEMGSGHTVTAFYEVIPKGAADSDRPIDRDPRFEGPGVDPLRYRQVNAPGSPISAELMNLRIRYKAPDGDSSQVIDVPLVDRGQAFAKATSDFRFAAAVAAFGMILRESPYKGSADWSMVHRIARDSKGNDRAGYREEFIRMADRASETWLATSLLLR